MYSGTELPPVDNATPEQLAAVAAASEKEFTAEMAEPPKPAIGTEPAGSTTPPPQAGGSMFDYVEPEKTTGTGTAPEPEPYAPFTDDGPAAGTAKQKIAGMSIDTLLNLRFRFEAILLSNIDSEASPDDYMPDEFELEMYREVYAPYKDVAADKLPPWLPLLMVEVVCTGPRYLRAFKARRVNKKNQAAARVDNAKWKTELVKAVVKSAEQAPSGPLPGKRTNWKIFGDGSYHYCRATENQKAVYRPQGTQPVEKVDLTNLEDVKRVIHASGWPKLQRAFNLPDNWPQSKGIDINNLGLEEE